jgi:sporulation protein YlmC with PRC-barrel domain
MNETMQNKMALRWWAVAVAVLAVMIWPGWQTQAAYAAGEIKSATDYTVPQMPADRPMTALPMNIVRTSDLMGTTITNMQGEKIGRVHDIVLTPDQSGISYVAIASGGVLGIGERLYAVPWTAVSVAPNGKLLTTMIGKKEFDKESSFNRLAWPDEGFTRWSQTPYWTDTNVSFKPGDPAFRLRLVSQITRLDAGNRQGQFLGSLSNLCIDKGSGEVVYGIVSWTKSPLAQTKLAAVPWNAVVLQNEPLVAGINIDKSVVESVAFNSSTWPNLGSMSYAQSLAMAFGEEPYQVYGYASPQGRERNKSMELESKFPLPKGRSPEPQEPVYPGGDAGY